MSFLDKIASILGFGPDPDEVDEDYAPQRPALPAAGDAPLEVSKEAETQIFAKVVEIFNAAQPQFIARSLDPEKQKRLLFDALDESTRGYLSGLKAAAQAECQAMFDQEREKLVAEAQALKKRAEELEAKRAEVHERQISAERQKRALSERVRDLEAQVIALEAEKEQYEIETKCMVNKAKATALLESEIEELRAQLAARPQAQPAVSDTIEIENLKAELAKAEERAQLLQGENSRLSQAVDQSKTKDEMSNAMFSDLQRVAAEANRNAKELQEQVDALTQEISVKDARIDDLNRQLQEKDAMLAEDEATKQEIEEIQRQVALFENVKAKMDARVEKLRASLQASQKENESLRLTIKNNLVDHAQEEKRLRDEIAKLKAETAQSAAEEAAPYAPEAESEAEPVDELLSGADWLVSTPPRQQSMRPKDDDLDFGYQPPQRRQRIPDNEAQMSLFD